MRNKLCWKHEKCRKQKKRWQFKQQKSTEQSIRSESRNFFVSTIFHETSEIMKSYNRRIDGIGFSFDFCLHLFTNELFDCYDTVPKWTTSHGQGNQCSDCLKTTVSKERKTKRKSKKQSIQAWEISIIWMFEWYL